jgi:hypothetical protein
VLTGVIGYDLENVDGASIAESGVFNTLNKGDLGSLICKRSFAEVLHHRNVYEGYGGSDIRAVVIAGSSNVVVQSSWFNEIVSFSGHSFAVDVLTDSQ